MGSLIRPPAPQSAPPPVPIAAPAPIPPVAEATVNVEDTERRKRLETLARRQKGLAGTIATSPRGLLLLSDTTLQRKSLLGQ